MSEVEFLVKLRDGAQIIADATNEYLETMAPADERDLGDSDSLTWVQKEGGSGPYQQARHEDNKTAEFEALQKKLQEHNGFWQSKNYKFWLHMGDLSLIDRRKKA